MQTSTPSMSSPRQRPALPSTASSAALALQASARIGAAVGLSVGVGLAGKAGYMALTRALPDGARQPLSLSLVAIGTVPAWAGAAVLADGVRRMLPDGLPLSERAATAASALGTLAFLAGMLGGACPGLDDTVTASEREHVLANAAGQVLAMFLSEAMASRLVPAWALPTQVLVDGAPLEPGSAQQARVQRTGLRGMFLAQVLAHVPLIWQVMGQVPRLQQAYGLGGETGLQPGESSPMDYLRAGLAVATAVAAVEVGRVTAGGLGEAAGQAWAGGSLVPGPEQEPEASEAIPATSAASPVAAANAAEAPGAAEDARTLSCLRRCQRQLARLARSLGLDAAAQGRAFGYVPLLNLTAGALVTGPGSDFVQRIAAWTGRPVIDTAIGLSGLANGALNLVDLPLRYHRPGGEMLQPAAGAADPSPLPSTSAGTMPSPSGVEISELRENDFVVETSELRESDFATDAPAPARAEPAAPVSQR